MTRRMMATVAGMLVLTLAGCGEAPSARVAVDAERAELVRRTEDLAARVTATGRMSEQDRVELAALAGDVDVWRTRAGQGDAGGAGGGILQQEISLSSRGGGTACTGVCAPVVVMGDLICFISGSACISGKRRCYYECTFSLARSTGRRAAA